MPRQYESLDQRFWRYVNTSGSCWLWTGHKGGGGYGHIRQGGKERLAHRVSYEMAYGSIPGGLDVLHRCDNPACVRPDHLWLGTHTENMADMAAKGRNKQPSGERSGQAKLTWEQVGEIRQKRRSGHYTLKQLGVEYGVHLSLISLITRGVIWREE